MLLNNVLESFTWQLPNEVLVLITELLQVLTSLIGLEGSEVSQVDVFGQVDALNQVLS